MLKLLIPSLRKSTADVLSSGGETDEDQNTQQAAMKRMHTQEDRDLCTSQISIQR